MKRWTMTILCLALILAMTACGGTSTSEAKTLGGKLVNLFQTEIDKGEDILSIAEQMASADFNSYDCVAQEMPAGYMPGFTEEISGFKRAVCFCPMIGSVPFVGYIFEVDGDAEGFKQKLEKLADPRWNICTEAQETVSCVSGNFVFFAMCPGEDQP